MPTPGAVDPAVSQAFSLRVPDAEPGEEQPGHRRHRHEPAQLSLSRAGHADTGGSVSPARPRHHRYHGRAPPRGGGLGAGRAGAPGDLAGSPLPLTRSPRRHAAPGGPGGVRARPEGGGPLQGEGLHSRRPAPPGGPGHQPLAAGAGRGDDGAAGPPAARALPRLAAHTPAPARARPRRHRGAAAAGGLPRRGRRRSPGGICMPGPAHRTLPPQISTRPEDLGETVCSLKFAERVGRVELGPARRRRTRRSGTPSSLSTDTPLTGTLCTPTPSPGSPASPGPDGSAPGSPEDLLS